MKKLTIASIAAVWLVLTGSSASAQMRITEWMYSGTNLEWFELTNIGNTSINMAGWSYDDDSELAGTVDLSAFGIVAAGESVILAEDTEANFRATWGLPALVDVIGSNTTNLGRNDEINLYDNTFALIDRLTFGDQTFVGSIRTQNASGNPITPSALGVNDVYQWQLAVNGDAYGSYLSTGADIGNPGTYTVPEPSTVMLLFVGGSFMLLGRHLKRARRAAQAS